MKIISLHGAFVSGNKDLGELSRDLEYFNGIRVYSPQYRILPGLGYFSCFRQYYIKQALDHFNNGDCFLAHSAGCTITLWALQELQRQGKAANKIFFLNAALDRDTDFPQNTYSEIYNFHESDDSMIKLSKLLPNHPYGAMGRNGYNGTSSNVFNYSDIVPNYQKTIFNHSSFFKSPAKETIEEFVAEKLNN